MYCHPWLLFNCSPHSNCSVAIRLVQKTKSLLYVQEKVEKKWVKECSYHSKMDLVMSAFYLGSFMNLSLQAVILHVTWVGCSLLAWWCRKMWCVQNYHSHNFLLKVGIHTNPENPLDSFWGLNALITMIKQSLDLHPEYLISALFSDFMAYFS